MVRSRKSLTFAAVAVLSAAGTLVGTSLLKDGPQAKARDVESARERLAAANVGQMANVFRDVGKVMEPSVVHIVVKRAVTDGGQPVMPFRGRDLRQFFPPRDGLNVPDLPEGFGGSEGDLFRRRGDEPPVSPEGTGSGVIMEAAGGSGFILTNNHVAGGASTISVTLADGRTIENGKVVGTDPKTDLAVIRIEADNLVPARWGNSDELVRGDFVMAFGSPFGFIGSMTHGIVSALNRQAGILASQQGYENFIQVDCPINPGNSGGPLSNLRGEVVGINTAIASKSGGFQGIGFAIPSNQARFVFDSLKSQGKVVRGWLGVSISDVARDLPKARSFGYDGDRGVLVEQAFEGGPAGDKLQAGDIIVTLDGKAVDDVQSLRNAVATRKPGTEVKFKLFRDGVMKDVAIQVGEQPTDLSAVAFAAPGTARRAPSTNRPGARADAIVGAEKFGLRLADAGADVSKVLGIAGGARVTYVEPSSPAASATGGAVRPGDVIIDVAGTPVSNAQEADEALAKADPAKGVRLRLANEGGTRFVFVRGSSR
jgi:serine protease Do